VAAEKVKREPGFDALDWRKRKRLKNKARRAARAQVRAPMGELVRCRIEDAAQNVSARWAAMWFDGPKPSSENGPSSLII